uniref:Uncharacterized protein n=1 Tax=Hyaloperonospora arabidopsidis (strain Emoy2) TaxID=559515 RepID=M4B1G6_HYAAE
MLPPSLAPFSFFLSSASCCDSPSSGTDLSTSVASACLLARRGLVHVHDDLLPEGSSRSSFHLDCLLEVPELFRVHEVVDAVRLVLRHEDRRQLRRGVAHDVVENLLLSAARSVADSDQVQLVLWPGPLALFLRREELHRLSGGDRRLERVQHALHHILQCRQPAPKRLAPVEEAGPESDVHLDAIEHADRQLALPRIRSARLHRCHLLPLLHWLPLSCRHRLRRWWRLVCWKWSRRLRQRISTLLQLLSLSHSWIVEPRWCVPRLLLRLPIVQVLKLHRSAEESPCKVRPEILSEQVALVSAAHALDDTLVQHTLFQHLQCLPLYSVLQSDSVLRTGLLIVKGELQSLLPYLISIAREKNRCSQENCEAIEI